MPLILRLKTALFGFSDGSENKGRSFRIANVSCLQFCLSSSCRFKSRNSFILFLCARHLGLRLRRAGPRHESHRTVCLYVCALHHRRTVSAGGTTDFGSDHAQKINEATGEKSNPWRKSQGLDGRHSLRHRAFCFRIAAAVRTSLHHGGQSGIFDVPVHRHRSVVGMFIGRKTGFLVWIAVVLSCLGLYYPVHASRRILPEPRRRPWCWLVRLATPHTSS